MNSPVAKLTCCMDRCCYMLCRSLLLFSLLLAAIGPRAAGQEKNYPNIAVQRVDSGNSRPPRPMDLGGKALRFRPRDDRFQSDSPAFTWNEPDGVLSPLPNTQLGLRIELKGWEFPFSGRKWNALYLNGTGSISFAASENIASLPRYFYYKDIAGQTIQAGPLLAPLWRRYGQGAKYSIQHGDNAVTVTFQFEEAATEANRFFDRQSRILVQTVLDASGAIEFRYKECTFVDGSVLVAPEMVIRPQPRVLQNRTFASQAGLDSYLDFRESQIEQLNSFQLRFTMQLRGAVPLPRAGLIYWFFLDTNESTADTSFNWTPWNCSISVAQNNVGQWQARYCGGEAVSTVAGDKISVIIPRSGLGAVRRIRYAVVSQDNARTSVFKTAGNYTLDLGDEREYAAERDLSAAVGAILPSPIWESFHHRWIDPNTSLFTKAYFEQYQDNTDFVVVFTAFPYDNTEIGGSLSGAGNQVSGINVNLAPEGSAAFGSRSRLQAVVNPIILPAPFHAEKGADIAGPWADYDRSMWLLTQLVGHRWGMRAEYMDGSVKRTLWDPNYAQQAKLSHPAHQKRRVVVC